MKKKKGRREGDRKIGGRTKGRIEGSGEEKRG